MPHIGFGVFLFFVHCVVNSGELLHERESVFNFAVTMNICIETRPLLINNEIDLPASKSISNRALMINALSGGRCKICNVAKCDDTDAMGAALSCDSEYVNVGAAGTAMRFLTAYFSIREGFKVTLDGSERMRQRPIKPLVDALNACGADIRYAGQEGYPPLEIHGRWYKCEQTEIDAGMSSQFISAVLMIAPLMECRQITLAGNVASRPYIDMTLGVMGDFGIKSQFQGNVISIEPGEYMPPSEFKVESDWTAASYWYAMQELTFPMSHIRLKGLYRKSLQGDACLCDIFEKYFGIKTIEYDGGVELSYVPICGECMDLDMSGCPDLAQTIIVLSCLFEEPFNVTGLRTLRIKETDRIEALRSQLLKLGYTVRAGEDYIYYDGTPSPIPGRCYDVTIETFDDHRMAMSFAVAALKHPGLVIADAGVVSKSYPDFWKHLAACGFRLKEVEL